VLFAAGVAIIYAAWRMPRFQEQLGQIYTAPGLVPALYGFVIVVLALWLAARAIGRGALEPAAGTASRAPREGHSNARLVLAIVLCLAFAVGMVGRLPFWLATFLFVATFIVLFELMPAASRSGRIRSIISALIQAALVAAAVTLVFQEIFLVRLP
jgi:putative tricarboxylic transport membrane protein